MIMPENFFNFTNIPTLCSTVIKEALTAEYKIIEYPNVIRAEAPVFKQTDFFKKFVQTFGKSNACYLKNYPMMLYDWHTDGKRINAINWLIKAGPKAATFHRDSYEHELLNKNRIDNNLNILFWKLIEVKYTQYQPTLIRTDVHHCVVNYDNEERIILSLSTVDQYSYNDIKDYLLSL
jgi:hypothetical protein